MKKLFSLFAAILFAGSMMAAVGNLYYTLAITQNPNNTATNQENSYTGNYEVTVDGLVWNLPGNLQLGDFWAIGGKSLTSAERATYSKTAMGDAIAKIVVSHSGTTSDKLIVDSVVLTVASDASFATVTDRIKLNPTVDKNVAGTVEFVPTSEQWATGSFYKISFFMSNSKDSNYRLPINKVEFFSYLDPSAPAITASNVDLGLCPTMTGSVSKTVELAVVGANLTEAITYTQGTNTTITGTLTAEGGTLSLTFAADAEGEYADHFMLQSGTTAQEISVNANVVKTDGNGEKVTPFTVADVVKLNNNYGAGEKFWVLGYILGSAGNGGVLAADAASNIALGDAADQETGLVPVELPSGEIREALNVVDNPTNKGKQVKVYGQLVSYFVTTGVKATSDYEWPTATAIENSEVAEKATKVIENGQLFIIKNGVKYNAQGAVVK